MVEEIYDLVPTGKSSNERVIYIQVREERTNFSYKTNTFVDPIRYNDRLSPINVGNGLQNAKNLNLLLHDARGDLHVPVQ